MNALSIGLHFLALECIMRPAKAPGNPFRSAEKQYRIFKAYIYITSGRSRFRSITHANFIAFYSIFGLKLLVSYN